MFNAQILDARGAVVAWTDGAGDGNNVLMGSSGIAVDMSGTVFVAGGWTSNVFKIVPCLFCDGFESGGLGAWQ